VREFGAERLAGEFVRDAEKENLSTWFLHRKLGVVRAQAIVYSPTYFESLGFDKVILIAGADDISKFGFEELWKARVLIAEADKERREYLESREVRIINHDSYGMEAYIKLSSDFDGMIEFDIYDPGAPAYSVTINPQDVMDAYRKLWEARYNG
jgi:hypothetical protein